MRKFLLLILVPGFLLLVGCGGATPAGNANLVNSNVNLSNTFTGSTNINANTTSVDPNSAIIETKEPDQYQAVVLLKLQATGNNNTATNLPTIQANVARSGADRRMEFNLPTGEKVLYLDKAGTTYLVLPTRKQYAQLDKQSLGFEVRQLMMPEQVVAQVRAVK